MHASKNNSTAACMQNPKNDNRNIRVLKFLEAYEKQESLWNPSLESYKNKQARDDAYLKIIDELKLPSLTINDVKLKVKSIRTTYKKEVRLLKKHKEEGKTYSPKLFWFNRANAFLKNVSISRQKTSPLDNLSKSYVLDYLATTEQPLNSEETSDRIEEAIEDDLNTSCGDYEFKGQISEIDGRSQENMDILDTTVDENVVLASSPVCNSFQVNYSNNTDAGHNPSKENHEVHSTVNSSSAVNLLDEYDFFCRSVAMQLRSIKDNYSRCVAKLKIQQILFEAETGHYKNNPCITVPVCQNINNLGNL